MTRSELLERFRNASPSFLARNASTGGVPQDAERQRSPEHEPVATDARKAPDEKRRLVRITSYRTKLCDERNLWDKTYVDSLCEAGVLIDDSPQHCKVEV